MESDISRLELEFNSKDDEISDKKQANHRNLHQTVSLEATHLSVVVVDGDVYVVEEVEDGGFLAVFQYDAGVLGSSLGNDVATHGEASRAELVGSFCVVAPCPRNVVHNQVLLVKK